MVFNLAFEELILQARSEENMKPVEIGALC